MKNIFLFLILLLLANSCTDNKTPVDKDDLTRYVDPFIGTGFHGHVFLGANLPFGAVQVGPANYIKGWDWCSGYHYSDSIVTGFSQLHLSGTGIGELGDVLITPYTGELKTSPGTQKNPLSGYASKYSHREETARPGYYSVKMEAYDILVELTATERVAVHRYTFPDAVEAHIAINLTDGIGWDKPTEASFKKIDQQTYAGYRFSTGWAKDQRVFFAIRVSKPIGSCQLFSDEKLVSGDSVNGEKILGMLNFPTSKGDQILLKVGISPVSEKNALANIEEEVPGWNFEDVSLTAHNRWNNELSKVKVKSKNPADIRTFYTALYHSFIHPVLFNDSNGDYRGTDKKVYSNPGFINYSIFSLWDTYRAEQPLFTILQPEG